MVATANGELRVYFLNVGQADTTVIVTPSGRLIVIDAAHPARKLCRLLRDLGAAHNTEIDLLVITHPHTDHYTGAGRMAREYRVNQAIFCPYWSSAGTGPVGYGQLVADLHNRGTRCQFLSGYTRFFPELIAGVAVNPPNLASDCSLELLGPSNGLLTSLVQQGLFDSNHLSIMSRISWRDIRIIIAADAQLENWSVFDSERMAEHHCDVLRAAHHGSGNGTQWERVNRLKPKLVVISSDLDHRHHLPDVTGAAVFSRYAVDKRRNVALTGDSGTIEVTIDSGGAMKVNHFSDKRNQDVNLTNRRKLTRMTNPTDWKAVLIDKANALP